MCTATRASPTLRLVTGKQLVSQMEEAAKELVTLGHVQLHKRDDGSSIITVPDQFANHAAILQNGIRSAMKSYNGNLQSIQQPFTRIFLQAFNENELKLLLNSKKVYVSPNPFVLPVTNLSYVTQSVMTIELMFETFENAK